MKKADEWLRTHRGSRMLLSIAFAALLIACLFAVCLPTYETNDDSLIVSVTSGLLTGEPCAATVSTSYLYGALLCLLYGAAPAVTWHALVLTVLIVLSLGMLLDSCVSLCLRAKWPACCGLLAFSAMLAGILLGFTVQLQFTAVAGLCFAAAMLTLLSDKLCAHRVVLALALTAFSFLLRPNVALMLCPLCIWYALCAWLRKTPERKGLAACLLACLTLIGAGALADGALYAAQEGWSDFAAFDEQTTALLDYNTQALTDEQRAQALEACGWSDELYGMVRGWYFLDERIQTDSLRALNETLEGFAENEPLGKRAVGVVKATLSVLRRYSVFGWNALGWGIAAAVALVWGNKSRRLEILGVIGYILLLVAYFYGIRGRFPHRLAFAAACTSVALLLPCIADAWKERRKLGAASLCLLLLTSACALTQNGDALILRGTDCLSRRNDILSQAVDGYALANSDKLYVTDFCQDALPQTAFPLGAQRNLIYWGSGISRSPASAAQLQANGYDERFSAANFFDDGVYLLIVGGEATFDRLYAYLQKDYGAASFEITEQTAQFAVYRVSR